MWDKRKATGFTRWLGQSQAQHGDLYQDIRRDPSWPHWSDELWRCRWALGSYYWAHEALLEAWQQYRPEDVIECPGCGELTGASMFYDLECLHCGHMGAPVPPDERARRVKQLRQERAGQT